MPTNLDGQKQLLISIFCNNTVEIQNLLNDKSVDINYIYNSPYEKSTLEVACCEFIEKINRNTIRFLIENGAEGQNVLFYAARSANLEIVKELIEHDYHQREKFVLISVLKYMKEYSKNERDYCEIVAELLKKVDVNIQDSVTQGTAVYYAAKYGYEEIVTYMITQCYETIDLDNFADKKLITARDFIKLNVDYKGVLPPFRFETKTEITLKDLLRLIRQKRETDFLDSYQQYTSQSIPENENNLLLLSSAERGLVNLVKYFLFTGVDSNKIFKNYSELFPLKFACLRGYYEVVSVLLNYANFKNVNTSLTELVRTKFVVDESQRVNHAKCLELLLENERIDINYKDEMENTALHYACTHQSSEIILSILRKGASLATRNKNKIMTIELLDAQTIEDHLNQCISFSKFDNVPNRNMIEIDFKSLLPSQSSQNLNDTSMDYRENCLFLETEVLKYLSTKSELRHFLLHPVIDVFLFSKWQSIKKYVLINLLFYILFICTLAAYVFCEYNCVKSDYNYAAYLFLEFLLSIFVLILAAREVIQICIFKLRYFKQFENWVEISLITSTIVLLSIHCTNDLFNNICAINVVSAGMELMLLSGRQFRILYISSMMLRTVSMTLIKWLLSYAILIVAFSFSFFFLFNHNENDEEKTKYFQTIWNSFFKTIVMITGEFELENLKFNSNYIIGPVLFILFVFLVNIVLLGVCTALAIDNIQTIIKEAVTKTQIVRIDHIVYWEKVLFTSKLLRKLICSRSMFLNLLKIKLIQDEPKIKINLINDKSIKSFKITTLYRKRLLLDRKTMRNIIAKTKNTKLGVKPYPIVDENFFFNLRKTIVEDQSLTVDIID